MAVEAVTVCEVTRGESGKVCWGTGSLEQGPWGQKMVAVFQKKWKREELWEDGTDPVRTKGYPWLWGLSEAGGLAEEGPEGLPVEGGDEGRGRGAQVRGRSPVASIF